MSTGLERIAAKARQEPKLCFTRLAHHIDAAWRWQNLCHVPHHTAPGSDGQTAEALKQDFVPWSAATLRAVHTQGYRPPPVRRTYIPKPGKRELRPLGVPCIGDRVLQRSVADVLSAIYEQDFLPCPFGGRPGVGAARILDRPKHVYSGRSEVAQRLLAEVCEGGGSGEGPCEVHHVRRLADLDRPGQKDKPR